jgi:hypothetical protein
MERYGIPRRTISEAGMQFPKSEFAGSPTERAYLIGLRTGDLHCVLSGNQVRVSTSTTHPAMWRLLSSVFGKYGRINKTPARDRLGFEWAVYAYLDRSFDLLLRKPTLVDAELIANQQPFLSFLSGYIDAEGSFRIYQQDHYSAVALRINSEDEGILRGIRKALSAMGYHVYFGLEKNRGMHYGKNYRRNVWSLGLFRKDEVIDLVGRLSLRHKEKPEWVKLIVHSRTRQWDAMKAVVTAHRRAIKDGVRAFRAEAERQYAAAHRPRPS